MFRSFYNRYNKAWHNLRKAIKPIVGFEIWFSLIFAVVLAPFTAWLVDNLLIWIGLMIISLAAADGRVISVSRVLGEEAVHVWSVIRLGMLQAIIYFSASLFRNAPGHYIFFSELAVFSSRRFDLFCFSRGT
jgi:hypothetical protein